MKKKTIASKIGATVRYCGHRGCFVADITVVEDACVVRAPKPITPGNLDRTEEAWDSATHHVHYLPNGGFWRPDLGVLVVPAAQCVTV